MANSNRKFMKISRDLLVLAHDWADRMRRHGVSEQSARCTGPWPLTVDTFYQSKVGEIATALYFGLDPEQDVSWQIDTHDKGYDIELPNKYRLDVKASLEVFNLVWPLTKNNIYASRKFDALVSVSLKDGDYSQTWIEGYITKQGFFDNKNIADGVQSPKLDRDTWWIAKAQLRDVAELVEWQPDIFAPSTIEATIWLFVHVEDRDRHINWLRRHPPPRALAETAYQQIQKPANRVTAAARFKMALDAIAEIPK